MARSLHISLGTLLAILILVRLKWRISGGTKLPASGSGTLDKLATGVHHLLYLLVLAVISFGLASAWLRGDNLFNLFTIPAFDPGNKVLRHNTGNLHGLFANALLIVAGLHAVAAIWHHLIKKDNVLRRMWPGLK